MHTGRSSGWRQAGSDLYRSTDKGLQAVHLAELGFHVFQLRATGKEPMAGTRGFREASNDPELAKVRWSDRPDANIGLHVVRGLVVIDTDTPEAESRVLSLDLPDCPTVITRRGRHRYFKGPGRSGATAVPGLDVKAGGSGYVVAAGSTVAGHLYEWADGLAPWEVQTPALPPELAALIATKPARAPTDEDAPIPEGDRNNALTTYAGSLRATGVPASSLPALLDDYNRRRCVPPLPASEVQRIARSARKWSSPPPWWSSGPDSRAFLADERLPTRARMVLAILTTYARPNGVVDPGPSIDTLARDAGLDRKTVRAALGDLQLADRVRITRRPRKATRYVISLACPRVSNAA